MDSRSHRSKKQRHPMAETIRGEGRPSFTARLIGVEVEMEGSRELVMSAMQAFVNAGQAGQIAVDQQLEQLEQLELAGALTCTCGCAEDVHRVDGRCTDCLSCNDFEAGAF